MMGGTMMGWMWLWPALILVGLAILGYLAVRLIGDSRYSSPRRILDERYARGEIDEEEYRRRRANLS